MNASAITGYLDAINWKYIAIDEQAVVTGYRCRIPFYEYTVPIEIRVSKHWVTIEALLQRGVIASARHQVLALLSTLNAHCREVRYFMVEDCVVLQAEVGVARCHLEAFVEALKNICRYASESGLEVAVLATNPSVAGLFERVELALVSRFEVRGAQSAEPLPEFDLSLNLLAD